MIYAYPFFFGTIAAGILALAEELPGGLRKRGKVLLSVVPVMLFGWLVFPAYAATLRYPYESIGESVALTRGQHEALPPAGAALESDVVTLRLWRTAPLYDPRAGDARTASELQSVIDDCCAQGRELYVTSGLFNYVRNVTPELAALLEDPAVFEKIAVLPSDDPLFTLHVFHLIQKP